MSASVAPPLLSSVPTKPMYCLPEYASGVTPGCRCMKVTGIFALSASASTVAPTLSLTGPTTMPSTLRATQPSTMLISVASSLLAWAVSRLTPSVPAAPCAKSCISFQYGLEMSGTTKPMVSVFLPAGAGVPPQAVASRLRITAATAATRIDDLKFLPPLHLPTWLGLNPRPSTYYVYAKRSIVTSDEDVKEGARRSGPKLRLGSHSAEMSGVHRLAPFTDHLSLQERTYQALRAALLDGEFPVGERIFEAQVA